MPFQDETIERILKRYPYPLAFPLKIAFAVDEREEPWKKVDAVLYSAEAVARFLGVVALGEWSRLRDSGVVATGARPAGAGSLNQRLERPSFGGWIEVSRETLRFLQGYEDQVVLPELVRFYEDRQAKAALDELCTMRNTFGHAMDRSRLPKDTFRQIAGIALGFLEDVLAALLGLEQVSFSYVSTIELQKEKRRDPEFLYKGKRLDGMDFVKEATIKLADRSYPHYKETDAVIIQFQERERYLNLFPFFLYDEVHGKCADLFYYNGRKGQRLEYVACGYGGMMELRPAVSERSGAGAQDWRSLVQGSGAEASTDAETTGVVYAAVSAELTALAALGAGGSAS